MNRKTKTVITKTVNNIKSLVQCDKSGSCLLAARMITKDFLKSGVNNFKVIEGYVNCGGVRRQHTWIEIEGIKVDPTFIQFYKYSKEPKYSDKIKQKISPKEYLNPLKWSENDLLSLLEYAPGMFAVSFYRELYLAAKKDEKDYINSLLNKRSK